MSNKRKWIFRMLAIGLGFATFVIFEGVCRVTGWGSELSQATPFTEFAAIRPLFVLSEHDDRWRTADNRREFFAEESFPATKSPDTFRIFVFGGSTVQGRPFSIPTSFPTFLKIGLQTAAPQENWEVVNCGGISYASYRLLPIMQECLQYQPDLYIVCTGHNEFLECITYSEVRHSSPLLKEGYSWLLEFHSFRLASQLTQSPPDEEKPSTPESTEQLSVDVDAILDHQGGLDAYNRDALNREDIVAAFETNLRDMVAVANSAAVPLLFVQPPSNLRDCPPFKSQFSNATDATTQQSILEALKTSITADNAVAQLEPAAQTDPHFALTWYRLGQALLGNLQFDEAKVALIRAKDEDVCPLRIISALEESLHLVAAETETPLLDAHELLTEKSRNGIVGDAVLVDHIHPSFHSNQQIAIRLMRLMSETGMTGEMNVGWEAAAAETFAEHLQSLDDLYFLRGQRTLKVLREWTQGRADGPPLP